MSHDQKVLVALALIAAYVVAASAVWRLWTLDRLAREARP